MKLSWIDLLLRRGRPDGSPLVENNIPVILNRAHNGAITSGTACVCLPHGLSVVITDETCELAPPTRGRETESGGHTT